MHSKSLAALVLALLLSALSFFVPDTSQAEPTKRVYAGVYLHDVAKFDQKDGVFDVDIEMWAKWRGDFDPEKVRIANAADVERTLLGQESEGAWHSARWRVQGTLRGEFPVQRFPFDEQTLRVILELPERDGELAPDLAGSGMRERFSVTGWLYEPTFVPRVGKDTYSSDLGSIAEEGEATAVNRVAFEVNLHRPLLTAAIKLFVPLLVILLVALIAVLVHPKWLDVRTGVGVTALLSCFAFQFSVADTMPSVAYMTLADVLFLVAYALTAVLLCVSVVASYLYDRERTLAWQRLDSATLFLVPVALVISVTVATWKPGAPPSPPIAPLGGDRPASSRGLVRVGTNSVATPFGGLSGRGTNWGTVREELDGTRLAVLAEEVPAITNDALRFQAGGQLDVTWRLREGLKWSDGEPLTAGDLEFALQVSPDPRIANVEVIDARIFRVTFKTRVAQALENINPLPRHVLQEVFAKGGYDAVREHRMTKVLPSAGPYRVVEFVAEDHVNLEANPHFIGPAPSIKRIEIRRYLDDAALISAFEAKQIDMIAPNAISPESALALAQRMPYAVKIRPSDLQMFLHPDPTHPILSKLSVRRALLMAIDRERLRTELFGESARISHVPVPGELPEGAERVEYDVETAQATLAAEGALKDKIVLHHGKTSLEKAIAAFIERDAMAVGLKLELQEAAKINDVYRKRKHGGLVLTQTTGERDAPPEKYWSLPQKDGKFDRSFRSRAYGDDISDLVAREERALYPERREQIRDLLFVEYSKRLPSLPLLFLADRIVAVPELEGWKAGSGMNFGTTIERWHFIAAK